jgi:hypothetical protein
MKGDLDGKAAIVTGGANGIGRLDALVTSAGIARSRPFLRTSLDLLAGDAGRQPEDRSGWSLPFLDRGLYLLRMRRLRTHALWNYCLGGPE